jgi:Fur family peroxide stress response transcriptional regulator
MNSVKQRLIDAGIQPSAPRMAIAAYVWNTSSHPTAEEVKHEVEKSFPTVSLATVYNTLNLLMKKNLLREVNDPGSPSTRYDCNTKPHFHLIDESTGEIMDLDPRVLRVVPDMSLLGKDFQITDIEVTLRGRKIK